MNRAQFKLDFDNRIIEAYSEHTKTYAELAKMFDVYIDYVAVLIKRRGLCGQRERGRGSAAYKHKIQAQGLKPIPETIKHRGHTYVLDVACQSGKGPASDCDCAGCKGRRAGD